MAEIHTIKELKEFWLKERPIDPQTGQQIIRYVVKSKPWKGRPHLLESVVKAQLIDPVSGKVYSKFFLYTEDAFCNANKILSEREA